MNPLRAALGGLLLAAVAVALHLTLQTLHARAAFPEAVAACAEAPEALVAACTARHLETALDSPGRALAGLLLTGVVAALLGRLLAGRDPRTASATAIGMGAIAAVLLVLLLAPARAPALAVLLGGLLGGWRRRPRASD